MLESKHSLIVLHTTLNFRPSFRATIVYTFCVAVIGFFGSWYQGFGFWNDSDRVVASGIGTAIFLFFSAVAVNIFSA
jgi:hypothetical protein